MRILYHHRTRGREAQGVHIAEVVAAFRACGHDVEVAALAGAHTAERPRMTAQPAPWHHVFRRVPYSAELLLIAYNVVGLPLLIWRALRQRSEVLYERYSLYNVAGVLAARLLQIPLVLEVNAPLAAEQSRDGHVRADSLAHRVERLILNAADHVIVVSNALRQHLVDAGVRPDHLVVQANSVNLETMHPRDGTTLRRSLGIENKLVIGYIGWFRSWHALHLLVDAAARLDLAKRNAYLLLIGDGPGRAEVERDIATRQLGAVAAVCGPLDRADVPTYLSLLDVAVLPAATEYCCPLKLLEYMAVGCAVVAPDQPNVRELVGEETGATLFGPGCSAALARALESCLADPERARRLGARGRAALIEGDHTWERNARDVVALVSGQSLAPSARPVARVSDRPVVLPVALDSIEERKVSQRPAGAPAREVAS